MDLAYGKLCATRRSIDRWGVGRKPAADVTAQSGLPAGEAGCDVHPAMLQLIWWHAAEEVEHRNVAFDVLQASRPSYALRIVGFLFTTFDLWFWTWRGSQMLMRQEGLTRAQRKAARREAQIRDGGHTGKQLVRMVRAYLKRDFHPDQFGDLDRARGRLAEIDIETPDGVSAA